jgi:hypothetical protein
MAKTNNLKHRTNLHRITKRGGAYKGFKSLFKKTHQPQTQLESSIVPQARYPPLIIAPQKKMELNEIFVDLFSSKETRHEIMELVLQLIEQTYNGLDIENKTDAIKRLNLYKNNILNHLQLMHIFINPVALPYICLFINTYKETNILAELFIKNKARDQINTLTDKMEIIKLYDKICNSNKSLNDLLLNIYDKLKLNNNDESNDRAIRAIIWCSENNKPINVIRMDLLTSPNALQYMREYINALDIEKMIREVYSRFICNARLSVSL